MEPDRYQQNKKVFIIAMICLLACIALLFFSLYIMPSLLLNWIYDVPEFIFVWREWLKENYAMSILNANILIFLAFFIPGICAGILSRICSNSLDDKIFNVHKDTVLEQAEEGDNQQTWSFTLHLLLILFCVVLIVFLIEWIIT